MEVKERRKADVDSQRFAQPSAALTFGRTDADHVILRFALGGNTSSKADHAQLGTACYSYGHQTRGLG
jgi:hypothetical protein